MFLVLAISAISMFWGGFVASVLWGWFIVPLGVQAITMLQAAGISCVISVFMGARGLDIYNEQETGAEQRLKALIVAVVLPLVGLISGFLIHSFSQV